MSCSGQPGTTVKKPGNLLSRYEMAKVLADMHVANAGLELMHFSPDSIRRMNAGYAEFILKKHQVSNEQFDQSFDYYLSVPTEMDSVYAVMVDLLTLQESRSRGAVITPAPNQP